MGSSTKPLVDLVLVLQLSSEVREDEAPRLRRQCCRSPEGEQFRYFVFWVSGIYTACQFFTEANPLGRGVEGCMPGTTGAEMPPGYNTKKDAEEADGVAVPLA